MYVSIDPGLNTGIAVFDHTHTLIMALLGDPRDYKVSAQYCVIEKPKVYKRTKSKGDPNDLITLAIRVGEYKQYFQSIGAKVGLVWPSEWKGQEDKGLNNARVVAALSPLERGRLKGALQYVSTSKQNNVIDAIGLGKAAFLYKLWPYAARLEACTRHGQYRCPACAAGMVEEAPASPEGMDT